MTVDDLRCDRCSSIVAPDDLRCPVCNLAGPALDRRDLDTTAVEILRCSGCGAAMTYSVEARAAACAFCGSTLEIEQPADPLEEAEVHLPFTIDREHARSSYRSWLSSLGWFRPGDLRSRARLESIQALRWVGWVFDAKAHVCWAADTDHDHRRSEWGPHAGRAELEYDDVIVAATRGLTPEETAILVDSYDLESAGSVADLVEEATVERFDIPRSAARSRLIEAVERLAGRRIEERHLPGRRSRNLHTTTVLRGLAARRCAFPAWVLAYRYKHRLYRTVLSGQDADCFKGEAPYSVARILAVIGAAATAVATLLALLLV